MKPNIVLFIVFILFAGCSSTQKIGYLSKNAVTATEFQIAQKPDVAFKEKSCMYVALIVPLNKIKEQNEFLRQKCGESWSIYDFEVTKTQFSIPLIFGVYCIETRGMCVKK